MLLKHSGSGTYQIRSIPWQIKDDRRQLYFSTIYGAKMPCKYQMTDLLGGIIRNILMSSGFFALQLMRFVGFHMFPSFSTSPLDVEHAPSFLLWNLHMRISINGGTQNDWFTMENTIKMDDWGYPYFRIPPYILMSCCSSYPFVSHLCWKKIRSSFGGFFGPGLVVPPSHVTAPSQEAIQEPKDAVKNYDFRNKMI